MPIRIAEVGGQYRNELSGSLGGLSRVRAMALNDGHLFCRDDQLEAEIATSLRLIMQAASDLGVEIARYRLSLRGDGDKYVDNPGLWNKSQALLRKVLDDLELPYEEAAGEAAFYGPKIDVQVIDAGRREVSWTTVQLDFLLPERFELSYVGEDGMKHRPVMIHRSIIGALERIVAHLIERWNGAFPVWLAPCQVVIIPVQPSCEEAAERINRDLLDRAIRSRIDDGDESLGGRIRRAQLQKSPFVCIVGPRENANGSASVRSRDGKRHDGIAVPLFVAAVERLSRERQLDLNFD